MPPDIGPGGLQPTGLAPPAPGPAAFGFKSRERIEDRTTRKPMSFWDRTKILILLAGLWFVFVLAATGDNPILPFSQAMREQARSKWWLLALIGIEVIRQLHYIVSERSEAYHRFWSERFFGNIERRAGKMNDWKRYRAGRTIRFLFLLFLIDMVLASILHTSPALALVQLPITLFRALPLVFKLMTGVIFIILDFGAMFWFLSRAGTEVYFPDVIKTRFSDVWGQASVLEKIKENIVFLEDPESIEKRGGYVPGGLLLWGPPGTGKTLMAEAVAGETGKPFVFVDPGAFTNMFMGVGILKVKSLFRKLRKLALRYGGVIVFFDEADSLGNRGQLAQGGVGGAPGTATPAPFAAAGCHGFSYLSEDTRWLLTKEAMASEVREEPGTRRNRQMVGGMMNGGGGGGMGTL